MSGKPEETWTDTIHGAITSTSAAVHRAVDTIAHTVEEYSSDNKGTTSSTTTAPASTHPFTGGSTTNSNESSSVSTGPTFGTTTVDSGTPASHVTGLPASTLSAPKPAPVDRDYKGETTTGMNVHTGTGFSSTGSSTDTRSSPGFGSSQSPQATANSTSSNQSSSTSKAGEFSTPTLTDTPSHTSTDRSDPSPNPSGPAQGGPDVSQTKSKHPSSSLPPPQTSGGQSATSRGDAPENQSESMSDQRQVNKGESIGSTDDESSRLKGTQQGGAVSMSGTDTSHPGAGATPAAGGGAAVGDPSSGQGGKTGKQGAENPLKEPPKSEEDAKDSGTGQKYVKSSGVAAEGGDFDAAKPGAGVNFLLSICLIV